MAEQSKSASPAQIGSARNPGGWLKTVVLITVASLIVLAGLLVGGVRLLDHFAPQYRQALATRIGTRIHARVQIKAIELGWSWSGPELRLAGVSLTRDGEDQPGIRFNRIGLGFSLLDLVHGKRTPDVLRLDGARLRIFRRANGRPAIAHWSQAGDPPVDLAQIETARRSLNALIIDNARITLIDPALPSGQTVLRDIDLQIDNSHGNVWQVAATAQGPGWLPQMSAHADIVGPVNALHRIRFALDGQGLRPLVLARSGGHMPTALASRLHGALTHAHVTGLWQDNRLQRADAHLSVGNLADGRDSAPVVPAFDATLVAHAMARANAPQALAIALTDLSGGPTGASALTLQAEIDPGPRHVILEARRLPSDLLLHLARLVSPRLAHTDFSVHASTLSLDTARGQPLQMAVGFDQLQIHDPRLSVGPIAGRYVQNGSAHRLNFAGAAGTLSAQRYLKGDLAVTGLGGALAWHRDSTGLHITADALTLDSRDATIKASGTINKPASGPAVVDLTAHLQAPDIARVLGHIPQTPDLRNPRLRDWLPRAITAGSLDSGELRVAGPMNRFPFAHPRPGEGFHLQLSGHGVQVHYKPDWPPIDDATGTLTLDGNTLDLAIPSGRMLGVALTSTHAHIDNVLEPVLEVSGHAANAPAPKLMAFLTDSPLRQRFGKVAQALTLAGQDDLDLDLSVPLKAGLGTTKVSGTVTAHDNTLTQKTLPGPITGINGKVAFDREGLHASGLTGDLLGVPLTTDLVPVAGAYQAIRSTARVRLPRDRAALSHYLPGVWLGYGKGHSTLKVAFRISRSGQISPITLSSSLAGMAIDLPEPAAKQAATRAPLTVTIAPGARQIDGQYDGWLNLHVARANDHLQRIQVLLNDPKLQPPDADGLWIGGQVDRLDALGWFDVVRKVIGANGSSSAKPASNVPAGLAPAPSFTLLGSDLHIGQLALHDRYFANSHIRIGPLSNTTGWRVDFDGPNTQGQVLWTNVAGQRMRIAGNLKRVALATEPLKPAAAGTPEPAIDKSPVLWADVSPTALPALGLYIQNFIVDDTSFGQARVDAQALADGWQLNGFSLANGALVGQATAKWQRTAGLTRANATADFNGRGLANLLRSFGYISPVRAKSVKVKTDLAIDPNPNGLDLRRLNGAMKLSMDHGTLLSVNPGPGRLLGLFNLYALPRRLRFDFRDVVDKGTAFDSAHADFRISNGDAFSKDITIKTPSARIGIEGRIGLAARDYDEHVTIAPQLGSGVAIASALIGGPIVGAAVFAVQELLQKPIRQFSSIGYTLKGSWDDPAITDPDARK